ncbi:Endonuclease/exonuclease/phosphatase, partial [Diaporthe sp. PMI_573]
MTYIRKGNRLKVEQRRPIYSRDILWLTVNGFSLLNFYRQPKTEAVLEYLIALSPPGRCIIGGDANAHHDLWEPGIRSENGGRALAKWSGDSGMEYTGQPGLPTQKAGHVLDLVFSNVPFVTTAVSEELRTLSDHETL